ncbi:oligosaccharide flippase family protein [Klebsiella pneumoniae]
MSWSHYLSHHQNDNAIIRKTYSNCVFSILYLVVPLMSGLAYLSSPFVSVIFGNQWTLTAEILKWLAPTAIIQAVLSSTGTVFIAKGRTDLLLKLGILGTFLYVLSFLIGVNFDIVTFSKLYFIANVLNFFPAMILMMRLIEGSLFTLLNKCFVIFFINFGMLAFLYFIDGLDFINAINEQVVYLILMISLGGGFYVLSSVLLIGKLRRFLLARFVN